jgi:SAM-dependent methyltransferase
VSFDVAARAYDAFMGRFSVPLAVPFADVLSPQPGQRVLDVGSGPGALTAELLRRGVTVTAVDPMEGFVAALADRHPQVEAHVGTAEHLPFADGSFDAAGAELVVHFMADPVAGLAEMSRVTRPGGLVAACVWDNAGDGSPLAPFWRAARETGQDVRDESGLAGSTDGAVAELMREAGIADVRAGSVATEVTFETFDAYWEPFTLGVGPAGDHVKTIDEDARAELRARCEEILGPPPFVIRAVAWSAVGRAG